MSNQCSKPNFAGKVSHGVYRPALGSNYTISVHQLLNANWGHFGSSTPILYSTQSQPCRPLQSKLSAFGDRTKAKSVHTGQAVLQTRTAGPTLGVWECLKYVPSVLLDICCDNSSDIKFKLVFTNIICGHFILYKKL